MKTRITLLVTLIAAMVLSVSAQTTTATEPVKRPRIGVFDPTRNLEEFKEFAGGLSPDIWVRFIGNHSFPKAEAEEAKEYGATLFLFWELTDPELPEFFSFDKFVGNKEKKVKGMLDRYLTDFAADAKKSGITVMLAPWPEMNLEEFPWGPQRGNTPAKFVRAWEHLNSFFADVPNIELVWVANFVSAPNTAGNAISKYFPKNTPPKYAGLDGFNRKSVPPTAFVDIFAKGVKEIQQFGVPICIASTASAPGAKKAEWIATMFDELLKGKYAFINYFGQDKSKEGEFDWRIDSDEGSKTEFFKGYNLIKQKKP